MGRFDIRTRNGQISGIIQSVKTVDADAQAFYDRVTAAGGSLSQTEKDAVNTLTLTLKNNGTWTLMQVIYPMVGASAAACSQNLKSSSFTGTFTSGWTFASTGVTPNGTSAYMDTGFNPFVNTNGYSQHGSMYSRTQNSSVNGSQFGCQDNSGSEMTMYQYFSAVSQKGGSIYIYPTTAVLSNNSSTQGLQIINRSTQTNAKLYFNGSILNTNTTSESYARPNRIIYLGASNWTTMVTQYSPHENSFTSFGDSLTDAQASDFYTAVQAFQTSLSRQV
jgi:hypothetical protein